MKKILRPALAAIAGIVVAVVLVMAVEVYSENVYPFPKELDRAKMDDICQHVAKYPDKVLQVVVLMYSGIAFTSTWLAGRLGNLWSAWIVGLLQLAMLTANILMLPYVPWFETACPVAVGVAILLAYRLSRRRKAVPVSQPTSTPTPSE